MNKKVIYIGVGAVVAYLLYKKFVASNTKTTEAEATEEEAAEEAPSGGGGGGGGSAAGAEATTAANTGVGAAAGAASSVKKKVTTKELGNIKPSSVMSGITAVKKPRNFGTAQRPTTPLKPIASRPRIAPAPIQRTAKFAGFLDLDNQDIQGQMM